MRGDNLTDTAHEVSVWGEATTEFSLKLIDDFVEAND